MGANGVSHHVVEDDLAGVACALRWLAYTPARIGEPPVALPGADPPSRAVEYCPGEGGGRGRCWLGRLLEITKLLQQRRGIQRLGICLCEAGSTCRAVLCCGPAVPAGEKLDPRAAIAGQAGEEGAWRSGLFDRGTWMECQV
jgi:acetyl-CoA carboxylase/biotin carboxylase 1